MPTTMDATEYLQKNGVIFAPGKAAALRRRGAGQYERSAFPVRRGTQNCKPDSRRCLRQASNRGGYPLYPDHRTAGTDQIQRPCTGGKRSPPADPAGAFLGLLSSGGVVRQRYLPCTKAPVQELSHGGILSLPKRVRASSATVGRGNVAECTENLLENELHFVKIFQNLRCQ